jgi:hypothetical protein
MTHDTGSRNEETPPTGGGANQVQWCEKSHPIHESLPGVKQDFFFFHLLFFF